ncbi:hypothetical protein [Pantoea agglomerans]
MKAIFLMLYVIFLSLTLAPFGSRANNNFDVKRSVEKYVYKNGKPYVLSKVYEVMAPPSGFLPYYIYSDENTYVYPFVFNREGIKGINEPYSRCNLAYAINGMVFIPGRKFNSGYAEDSEQCLGFDGDVKTLKNSKGIEWFVTKAVYEVDPDKPDSTYEVYFYLNGFFCFSKNDSHLISVNEGDILILKNKGVAEKDFMECSKGI